jgi:tripartite ATP-independent transporter DctM subunit
MAIYLIIGLSLIILLALKVPVAFAMIISSIIALLSAGDVPMIVVSQRLWGGLESFPLLAIPFFVFAGILMNKGGGAEAIFSFCMSGIGHIKGGLAYVNVIASIIFAGMSGAATADAAGLGAIEINAMKNEGYSGEFSAAVTAASSVIGPIIPPSVPLVVYGVMAQVSIGQLFIGGVIPGLVMAATIMIVIYIVLKSVDMKMRKRAKIREILHEFKKSFWALLAPIIILGGIFSGFFTPTEAGVIAALYALILGFIYKGLKLKDLPSLIKEAMLTTAQVTFIVSSACLFGWVLTRYNFPSYVANSLLYITDNKYVALLLITAVLLILGCFIDAIALIVMMTPVIVPIAIIFDISLVQTGMVLVLTSMIGLNTPPVGICLYIVSDLAKAPIMRVAKSLVPFYIALIVSVVFIVVFPELTTYLPSIIKF